MRVYDAKVNHMTNPMGFFMDGVSFSWKVDEARGKAQKAARVRVAADEKMQEILFDSGMDEQADSLAYPVELALEPRTRYFWQVTVLSDAEEEADSEVQWFETSKMSEEWTGKWLTCDSTEKRHPIFSKEIAPAKEMAKARLYVTGLGLYEAYIDGKKVGDEYLTPYSNNYNRWVQYQTYDITDQIAGGGKLSILLGNGWYKGRFGFSAFEDKGYYGNEWKVIADVVLTYTDGAEEVIGTDESWTVTRSRIMFSNLYDGEQVDATAPELPAEEPTVCDAPKGRLEARRSLPVVAHEHIKPVELIHTPAGEQVFDMGQNFAGIFTFRVKEPAGTKIHIQTGEVLQKGNFYNENLRSAKSEYIYISDGNETVIRPHFTYYGYRYVKVEGVSDLKIEDFTGLALYSDIEMGGDVETGHDLVNQLVSNVRWGMKGNFIDVPTDCPQRDERMGWTGDTQVFSPTATFLADTYAFYSKYLHDMYTEQMDLDGMVPDVVPSAGVHSTACVWGDSSCIIPWNMYQFYGDKKILEDQYDSMRNWVDYISRVDGDNHGWRSVFHYGDWLALDNPSGKTDEVMGGTDEGYIANVYYAASAGIVAKAARVLGYEADAKTYQALCDEQFEEVKKEYFSQTGRCCIKTQTALILALKYHLSENEELTKKTLRLLFQISGDKLKTGFTGMPLMCPVLSENGMNDLAYTLLLNEDYPGWLHEVKLGATTVWERWNSLDENGDISSTGMNSLNHYAYGSILEWVFRYVTGFRVSEEHPGSRHLLIAPTLNWKLKRAKGSYHSAAGTYETSWELADPSHVTVKVTVPFGCTAEIVLPLVSQETLADQSNPLFADVRDGKCFVGAGTYEVSYETTKPAKKMYSTYTPIQELVNNPEIVSAMGEQLHLDQIPGQALAASFRQLAEAYPSASMSAEMLDQLDAALARF
ncbi:MAG: family 78 glycoside hydrolase catalytic domain [Oscillospiraceae bacterium]